MKRRRLRRIAAKKAKKRLMKELGQAIAEAVIENLSTSTLCERCGGPPDFVDNELMGYAMPRHSMGDECPGCGRVWEVDINLHTDRHGAMVVGASYGWQQSAVDALGAAINAKT